MATKLQKKAFRIMMKEDEAASVAMIRAGYSAMSAHKPSKLTRSNGFQELLAKEIPQTLAVNVHKEGMMATTIGEKLAGDGLKSPAEVPEHATRAKFLDMYYRLNGNYAPEKHLNQNVNIGVLLDELQK